MLKGIVKYTCSSVKWNGKQRIQPSSSGMVVADGRNKQSNVHWNLQQLYFQEHRFPFWQICTCHSQVFVFVTSCLLLLRG